MRQNQRCHAYHHTSSHLRIKKKIGTAAVHLLPHRHLGHRRVVKMVPTFVGRVLAVSCVVTEVYLSRVIHYSHKFINWIFDSRMLTDSDQLAKVKCGRGSDSMIQFLLAVLSVRKPFDLYD